MRLFRRKKSREEEDDLEEDEEKRPIRKKHRDLNSSDGPKKKAPPKPWGKKERLLVFIMFAGMTTVSAVLAASARSWKLPGIGKLEAPDISFQQEFEITNDEPKNVVNEDISSQIQAITSGYSGIYATYVLDLNSNKTYGVEENQLMQAASLIKLPVMAAAYKEAEEARIDLDEEYSLKNKDKTAGSGSLYYKAEGTRLSYRELIKLMGQQSDNTAFTIMRKTLGDAVINKYIEQFGMNNTSLDDNITTAKDIGLFFERLWDGRILSSKDKAELLEFLTNTIYEDWIPAYIPSGVEVAHKYGSEVHVINDAGIVYTKRPFVLVIMTQGIIEKEVSEVFPQIVNLIYNFQESN